MRYVQHFKISNELFDSFDGCQRYLDLCIKTGYVKGKVYLFGSLQIAQDGEDFVQNKSTVLVKGQVFRVPRILKRNAGMLRRSTA